MAKDRDRRYQSPEQLVRDLLNLAGAVGLERTPAQIEYWMAHGHRPTWERHLVWMLPALGFFVVITGLVWWGYEFSKPSSGSAATDRVGLGPPSAAGCRISRADPTARTGPLSRDAGCRRARAGQPAAGLSPDDPGQFERGPAGHHRLGTAPVGHRVVR